MDAFFPNSSNNNNEGEIEVENLPLVEVPAINLPPEFESWYNATVEGQQFSYASLSKTDQKKALCRWKTELRQIENQKQKKIDRDRIQNNKRKREEERKEKNKQTKQEICTAFIKCENTDNEEDNEKEIQNALECCTTSDLLQYRENEGDSREEINGKQKQLKEILQERLEWSDMTSVRMFRVDNPGASIEQYFTYIQKVIFQIHNKNYYWDAQDTHNKSWYKAPIQGVPFNTNGSCLMTPYAYVKGKGNGVILIINNEKYFEYLVYKQKIKVHEMFLFFPRCMPDDTLEGNFANSFKRYKYMPSTDMKPNSKKYTLEQLEVRCNDYQNNFFLWCWYRLYRRNIQMVSWMLHWASRKIKYPRERMDRIINLVGEQGAGKTIFFQTIFRYLMGPQFYREFSKWEDLTAHFNGDWAPQNLFILLDDFKNFWSREVQDDLTQMISRTQNHIKEKYGNEYDIENYRQYASTSNPNRRAIQDDDVVTGRRRNVNVQVSNYFCDQPEFWKEQYINKHCENPEEMQKLFNFLYELDVSKFIAGANEEWMHEGSLIKMFEGEEYIPLYYLALIVTGKEESPRLPPVVPAGLENTRRYLSTVHETFCRWCAQNEKTVGTKKKFYTFLEDQGFPLERDNHNKTIMNITRENVETAIKKFTKTDTFTCEMLLEGGILVQSETGNFKIDMEKIIASEALNP